MIEPDQKYKDIVDGYFVHYATGVTKLDRDHREILILLEFGKKNPSRELTEQLNKKFNEHVKWEEEFMNRVGYPILLAHSSAYKLDHTQQSKYTLKEKASLLDHIEWHDIPFVKWLKENHPDEIK